MRAVLHSISASFLLVLALASTGCKPEGARPPEPIHGIRTVAVLPVVPGAAAPEVGRSAPSLREGVFEPGRAPLEAARALTKELFLLASKDPRFVPATQEECKGLLKGPVPPLGAEATGALHSCGRAAGADAVLEITLLRWRERVGSELSAERPASVGLLFRLFRTRDGALLWRYGFDETQRPLSENLFKIGLFKRTGGRWTTASGLARIGLERGLEELRRLLR